jgi:general secretion pathway protein D
LVAPPHGSRSTVLPSAAILGFIVSGCVPQESIGERHLYSERGGPPPYVSTNLPAPPSPRPPGVESFGTPPPSRRFTPVARSLPVVTGTRVVQLDFSDVPIASVVNQIVGDMLQLPLTIDPDVTGNMNLKASGIPISEVPARLDQALRPYGYGLAEIGGRVRAGRLQALDTAIGASQTETRVIPLNYVRAADIVPVIQQNAPDTARVVADPAGRGIVATGPPAAVATVAELVALFDTDTLRSRSFGLYPLVNTTPAPIVNELRTIFHTDSADTGPRFAAIDRLNAVLAVTDTAAQLVRVRQAIRRLDTAPEATASVHVYPLQFRRAAELATVLANTFAGTNAPAAPPSSPAGLFSSLSVGASTSSTTTLAARLPGMQPSAPPAQPVEAGGNIGPPATPEERAAKLGLSAPVRIEADPGLNALVILASPADYQVIEQTIRRLDVRPKQIFIEAAIAEVTLTDALKYGIDYAFRAGTSTFLQTGLQAAPSVGGGFTYVLRQANIALTLEALSAMTTVKVISAPRVLVLDNGTATLQVGNQVPIQTETQQSTQAANAPIVNQIELRDTGVILAVTPRIGSGSTISLDIFQEVSLPVTTTTSTINSPTIQIRRVQSTVSVQSGDTVALGGLMADSINNGHWGVPVLSSIPVLGNLFGTTSHSTTRTELVVLITPRMISGAADTQAATDELRQKLNELDRMSWRR